MVGWAFKKKNNVLFIFLAITPRRLRLSEVDGRRNWKCEREITSSKKSAYCEKTKNSTLRGSFSRAKRIFTGVVLEEPSLGGGKMRSSDLSK